MKVRYLLVVIFLGLLGCDSKISKVEKKIIEKPIAVDFAYFHHDFFNAKPQDFGQLRKKHPYMFPPAVTDALIMERQQDSFQRVLYAKTKLVFGNFDKQKQEMVVLFKHFHYYFPGFKSPLVVTDITGLSYEDRVLYHNGLLLISLDMFLGKDDPIYGEFSGYLKENFTPDHMTTEVAKKIIDVYYPYEKDRTFLGKMIFEGKKLYLLDLLLPEVSEKIKLGYELKKLDWAHSNEEATWSYFIKNNLLYETNPQLNNRFLEVAPFSKFYLSIDRQSAGYIGKYMGLQIVKSYVEKHQPTVKQLMETDGETIFEQSGFKPTKRD